MRGIAIGLILTALPLAAAVKIHPEPLIYYVQLVRGTDEEAPPPVGSRRIGPKLSETFHAVFRLRNYWELDRQQVALLPGQRVKVRLTPEREVEIDLRRPELRRVTAFQNGEAVDRIVRPSGEAKTIIGGKRDSKSAWFVVVRRDKPQDKE